VARDREPEPFEELVFSVPLARCELSLYEFLQKAKESAIALLRQVRGRFSEETTVVLSLRHVHTRSASLKIVVRHPKKTFATKSANSGHLVIRADEGSLLFGSFPASAEHDPAAVFDNVRVPYSGVSLSQNRLQVIPRRAQGRAKGGLRSPTFRANYLSSNEVFSLSRVSPTPFFVAM